LEFYFILDDYATKVKGCILSDCTFTYAS